METITVYQGSEFHTTSTPNEAYDIYLEAWQRLHQLIEAKMNRISQSIYDQLLHFIDTAYSVSGDHVQATSQTAFVELDNQIPTAILLAGVNTPDHQLIYNRIRTSVHNRGGHVAIVNPGSDTISSRSLMSAVVRQFFQIDSSPGPTEQAFNISSDSDSDVDAEQATRNASAEECLDEFMKRFTPSVRFTYWALAEWYNHKIQRRSDTSKRTKADASRKTRHSMIPPKTKPQPKASSRLLRSSLFTNATTKRVEIKPQTTQPAIESEPATNVVTDSKHLGPFVIILPQVEVIPVHVLQDFIALTASYVVGHSANQSHGLPICLVLGLSTNPEVGFEARLDASTLSRLRVAWFTVPPPAVFLDAVFNALLDAPGFHLSHSACSYLVDTLFLCLDYSVQNFIRRLQFCMLEHYLNTPHPKLLLPLDQAWCYLNKLSPSELAKTVTMCYPSVASLVANGYRDEPPVPPECDSLVARLAYQLECHWRLQYMLGPVLNWLVQLAAPITTDPLGKSVSDVYRRWLKTGLVGSEEFELFKNLFNSLSKETLLQAVERAAASLNAFIVDQDLVHVSGSVEQLWPQSIREQSNESLTVLASTTRRWLDTLRDADTAPSQPVIHSPVANVPKTEIFDSTKKKKMSLRGLRQHLQEVAASSPSRYTASHQSVSEWDQQRREFIAWVQSQLEVLIPSPTRIPLHEVFYGPGTTVDPRSASAILRRRLNPSYQKRLHQVLIDPGQYLNLSAYHLPSPDCISASLPDLSILYKLHLESGKLINLYDWLMAFATVLGKEVDKENPPDKSIQARFFHGIAQLHHMGYIKSTKRKADHVMRLTWSLDD